MTPENTPSTLTTPLHSPSSRLTLMKMRMSLFTCMLPEYLSCWHILTDKTSRIRCAVSCDTSLWQYHYVHIFFSGRMPHDFSPTHPSPAITSQRRTSPLGADHAEWPAHQLAVKLEDYCYIFADPKNLLAAPGSCQNSALESPRLTSDVRIDILKLSPLR